MKINVYPVLLIIVGMTVAFYVVTYAAFGQEPHRCAPQLGAMSEQLAQQYGQKPIGFGVAASGHLITQFASDDGATWTFVATNVEGTTCVEATGRNWESLPPGEPG